MNIRFFYLVCGFALSCLTFSSHANLCNLLPDQYPDFDGIGGACKSSGASPKPADVCGGGFSGGSPDGAIVFSCLFEPLKSATCQSKDGFILNSNGDGGGIEYVHSQSPTSTYEKIYGYLVNDCELSKNRDFPNNNQDDDNWSKSGSDATAADDGAQDCGVGGHEFTIDQEMNCGDYCEIPNPKFLEMQVKGINSTPTIVVSCNHTGVDPSTSSGADSLGPTNNSGWDCSLNKFMCDYDTNGDGQVNDGDDMAAWPDGSNNTGNWCIGSLCDVVETHDGKDYNGDGKIGDSWKPDPNSSNTDGSKTTGEFGGNAGSSSAETGIGSSGSGVGIDPITGELIAPCDDFYSCKQWAFKQYPNCIDGTRDLFIMFYNSPTDFLGECHDCDGPDASKYSECSSIICPYGFNTVTQQCWSGSCPGGDCASPNDPSNNTDVVLPDSNPEQEDSGKLLASVNDILRTIKANPAASSNDIENQTAALDGAIANLKTSNESGTNAMITKLETIRAAVVASGGGGSPSETPIDLTGVEDRLDLAVQELKNLQCRNEGFDGANPDGTCTGDNLSVLDSTAGDATLDTFEDAIGAGGIGQAISSLAATPLSVSSECGGVLIQSFKLKLGTIVDTTLRIDVCQWLTPIQDFLRSIALLVWGLISLRKVFEA